MNKKLLIGLIFLIGLISLTSVQGALTDNLVHYYSFDTDLNNVTSINSANTSSNATNVGVIRNITGKVGINAKNWTRTISGANHIYTDSSVVVNETYSYSLGGWFKPTDNSYGALMFMGGTVANNLALGLFIGNMSSGVATNKFELACSKQAVANYVVDSTSNFSLNTWHHVVMLYDGTTKNMSLYVNGAYNTSVICSVVSTTQDTTPLRIGSRTDEYGAGASYDEIFFYTRKLSASEIAQLYNGGTGTTYPFTNNYISFVSPSESGTTKYLPNNYLLVNVTTNISNYVNMTLNVYNSTGLYYSNTTSLNTSFWNITLPMINDTYYYNVTARNTTNSSIYSNTYTNYILYSKLNITAFNLTSQLSSFSANVNGVLYNTTTSSIIVDVIQGQSYSIVWNTSNYAYAYANVTINSSSTSINATLYPRNSLYFQTYLGLGMYNATTTTIRLDGSATTYNTSTDASGRASIFNVAPDTYTLTFTNALYGLRQQVLIVPEGSTQNISLVLANATQILFNFRDPGGNSVKGVLCNLYTSVTAPSSEQSAFSDGSGRITFLMVTTGYNRLECSMSGFVDYVEVFNPVQFTSYTITLSPSNLFSAIPTGYVITAPNIFFNGQNTSFNISFVSPYNNFVSYSYSFSHPNGVLSGSGSDSSGDSFSSSFYINATNVAYPITLNYYFLLDDGSSLNRTFNYVTVPYNSKTLVNSGSNRYGQQVGDRIMVVTFILIAMMGIAWVTTNSMLVASGLGGFILLIFIRSGYLGIDGSSAFKIFGIGLLLYLLLRAYVNR